jgi:single-stranded-DNA-specific exonuclease
MLHAKARWVIPTVAEEDIRQLAEEINISHVLARLLIIRGMTTADAARAFLYATENELYDPFLLDGMSLAVERIQRAIAQGERIRIYGDYDADGISSTSLMIGLMQTMGAKYDYYIPHRKTEGYGLNVPAIELAKEQGINLIITVDTGISAVEQAVAAKDLGMDLIVTDHHEPPAILPDTYATINPKKPGCPYPFKSLAGVGVAFKLAHALLGRLPSEWLAYAAIGTIADLMPLVGENRIIVKLGLEQIRITSSAGIRALLDVSNIQQNETTAGHIGFSVAPRINASGRLERADTAVKCLTADTELEAKQLAHELDRMNKERQSIVEEIVEGAYEQAQQLHKKEGIGQVLVLAGEDWNVGVVGIVASKVLERYYRPTIILDLNRETGLAKGSARSIPGFDLYAALTQCKDLLTHYGGHQAAAGMTLPIEHIEELRMRLNAIASEVLSEEDLMPVLTPDMEIEIDDVTVASIAELELLGPFGMSNPTPSFVIKRMKPKEIKLLGKDRQHLKLTFQSDDISKAAFDGLAFGKADWARHISQTDMLELYGELNINEWNGRQRPQMMIKDLQINERQIFDWRGISTQEDAMRAWLQVEAAEPGAQGILIFEEDELNLLPQETSKRVWLYREDAAPDQRLYDRWIAAADADNDTANIHEVKELLWLVMPANIRIAEKALSHFASLERIYAVFYDTKPYLSCAMPDREQFKRVYGTLTANSEHASDKETIQMLQKRTRLTSDSIRFILAVFDDLGFIQSKEGRISLLTSPPKRDLSESSVYQEKLSRDETERIFVYSTSEELKEWLLSRVNHTGGNKDEFQGTYQSGTRFPATGNPI